MASPPQIVNRQLRELTKAGLTVEEALPEVEEALEAEGLTTFDLEDQKHRERTASQTINVSLKRLTEEERYRYKQLAVFPRRRSCSTLCPGEALGIEPL